jgi:hypothetical protein
VRHRLVGSQLTLAVLLALIAAMIVAQAIHNANAKTPHRHPTSFRADRHDQP